MRLILRLFFTLGGFVLLCQPAWGESAISKSAMVATVHPLATDAANQILASGGNAVDAAIAAALALSVVDSHNSGIGGGCFILIRTADGELIAIDGREKAPAKATRDMFLRDGKADPSLSQDGPLAVGVPGALAAHEMALEKCGTKKIAEVLQPAIRLAEEGFAIDGNFANRLQDAAPMLAKWSGPDASLLKAGGQPYAEGEKLVQPDLAKTLQGVASRGIDYFYNGPVAEAVGKWMAENGGVLAESDFQDYRAVQRTPLQSTYRGYTIVGFPPPSSGGVHVAQMLNILEQFDLAQLQKKDQLKGMHIIAEAMKLAFADRAYWLGDADFVPVPQGLADKSYAKSLAERIDEDQASPVPTHGTPSDADTNVFGDKHTTHIAAADAQGNWVAMTATVNTGFGSKVIVPGTGVVLNNEMDDFSAQPGAPNAFGLVGAENNAVEPGKRPLSSMSPTIVLKEGEPVMTVGAAGGPKIITQVLLTIIRTIDYNMDLEKAVADPRFHHQWKPDRLIVERSLPGYMKQGLKLRGHKLTTISGGGVCQAIRKMPDGSLKGVFDPRIEGKAAGPETVSPPK